MSSKRDLILQLKEGLNEVLLENGIDRAHKKDLCTELGITPTYLNQLLSDKNTKIPSADILTGLNDALQIQEDSYDTLVSLRKLIKGEKKTELKTSALPKATPQYLQIDKISRSDAIKQIQAKIAANPKDLAKFTSAEFKGFDNLSTLEVQIFFNRYVLNSSESDSVVVFESRTVTREVLRKMLATYYYDTVLPPLSNEDLVNLAKKNMEVFLTVQENPKPKQKPKVKLPIAPQVEDKSDEVYEDDDGSDIQVPGEEVDEVPELDEETFHDESEEFDSDDETWVAPNEDSTRDQPHSAFFSQGEILVKDAPPARADVEVQEYDGGISPTGIGGEGRQTFSEMKQLLREENKRVQLSRRGLEIDAEDVTNKPKASRRRQRRGTICVSNAFPLTQDE